MYKTKFFLFFILTTFVNTSIESSLGKQSRLLLKNFNPNQVNLLIPRLLTHQENTNRCFASLLLSDIPMIAETEHHPNIVFSYLLLCEKLKIKPIATLSYSTKCYPEHTLFITQQDNQHHHVGISNSFKKLPCALQYLQLLCIVHSLSYNPPLTAYHNAKITKEVIQTIVCPVCLKMATVFNEMPLRANLFQSQIRKAIHLCPAHQKYNTDKLEENLYEFKQIKENLPIPWHKNLSEQALNLMNEIKNDADGMGGLLDHIASHMLPKEFA